MMRPTTVRFAHTNSSVTRRRSGFTTAPKAKKVTPIAMTLVEKTALLLEEAAIKAEDETTA